MDTSNKQSSAPSYIIIAYIIAFLWLILIIGLFLPLIKYGIVPRNIAGLKGIILAPFIHASPFHLIGNSLSLFILGWIFISLEKKKAIMITILIIILGGLGTWLIGRGGAFHIGASGVIYGIMGYLFLTGIFNRNVKTIIVSLLTFFLYGGAIWGVFPTRPFVSWEGHLCGLVAGAALAKFFSGTHKENS